MMKIFDDILIVDYNDEKDKLAMDMMIMDLNDDVVLENNYYYLVDDDDVYVFYFLD